MNAGAAGLSTGFRPISDQFVCSERVLRFGQPRSRVIANSLVGLMISKTYIVNRR